MITNYSTLQTAVLNWLHRPNLNLDRVKECIALGEARIRRELRVRAMEASANLTISSGTTALPTGFIGARSLYLNTDPKRIVSQMSPENLRQKWAGSMTGYPRVFCIEGENFVWGPSPDATYTGVLVYYALTALSDSATTNALLTAHPDLYLFASLVEAGGFISAEDGDIAKWEGKYQQTRDRVHKSNILDRYSGSVLVAQPDMRGP